MNCREACRRQPSAPSRPVTPAPTLNEQRVAAQDWVLGDCCQIPAPRKASPGPALTLIQCAPNALPVHSGQPGPAGRRADRQTPRCRAVSGCARVCESKAGSTPVTLSPCSARPGNTERGPDWSAFEAEPPPQALLSVCAASLRFQQGTFTCPGTPKNYMQNRLLKCFFSSLVQRKAIFL